MQDSIDGATEQVTPVLSLPPKMRIATVTGWMKDLDKQLSQARFAASPIATDLKQQIRDFTEQALSAHHGQEAR